MTQTTFYKSPFFSIFLCISVALFYGLDYLIQVSPSVMSAELMTAFQTDKLGFGLLGAWFFYGYILMQVPSGYCLDRFGARLTINVAAIIMLFAIILFAQTTNIYLACMARFLMGVAASVSFIGTVSLCATLLPTRYFAIAVGGLQLLGSLGAIFGQLVMERLLHWYNWRVGLLIIAAWCFCLCLIYVFNLPKQSASIHKASVGSISTNLYQLLQQPPVWWIGLCSFIGWLPVVGFASLWGIDYLCIAADITRQQAAQFMVYFWIGVGLGAPFAGALSNHLKNDRIIMLSLFVFALASSLLLIIFPQMPQKTIIPTLFFYGLSASSQTFSFVLLRKAVSQRYYGIACGFNNMVGVLGGGLVQPFIGWLLATQEQHYANLNTTAIFQKTFIILPCFAILALLVCYFKLNDAYGTRN